MAHTITDDKPLIPVLKDNQSIKVIGLGGVGGIVARYGAMFLAPLTANISARLLLIDGDEFEPNNATRMFFADFGNKAATTLADLEPKFEETNLLLGAIAEYVEPDNIARLIKTGDIVLLCVDNHATRKLVSEHCTTLDNITLISGGNDGIGEDKNGRFHHGSYGNCQIYIRRNGKDCCPTITKYHVEIDEPADMLPTEKSCIDALMATPQLLLANLAAGSSILNALWLVLCEAIHYSELAFDISQGLMKPLGLPAPKLEETDG